MTGLAVPLDLVGRTPALEAEPDLHKLLADLNGPEGDRAMRLLAQEVNELFRQDPGAAADVLRQLRGLRLEQLIALLGLLSPLVQGAVREAVADRGGGGSRPVTAGRPRKTAPTPQRDLAPVAPRDRGRTVKDTAVPPQGRYAPGSAAQVALFREAAKLAGVPESWATSPGLQNILRRESNGEVGRPNYTYGGRAKDRSQWGAIHQELKNGRITARSSATGLGQLLLKNVDRYYPNGRAGIGDPLQEAAGMMRYIKDRYGNPENAWRLYGKRHEGY